MKRSPHAKINGSILCSCVECKGFAQCLAQRSVGEGSPAGWGLGAVALALGIQGPELSLSVTASIRPDSST